MFFDSKDLKSNFLQKKNKEKKKIQQSQQQNVSVTQVQKNIRAFIDRNRLEKQLTQKGDVIHLLLVKNDTSRIEIGQLSQLKDRLLAELISRQSQYQYHRAKFYLIRLFFTLINNIPTVPLAYQLLQQVTQLKDQQLIKTLIKTDNFITLINSLILQRTGTRLLNFVASSLYQKDLLTKIEKKNLFQLLLQQFSYNKIQEQTPHSQPFAVNTLILLVNSLYEQSYLPDVSFVHFQSLANTVRTLLKPFDNKFQNMPPIQSAINYLISLMLISIQTQQKSLVQQISNQYNHLLILMQDEQDLLYFQNKILSHQKMESFSAVVLKVMQEIFESDKIVKMFFDMKREESKLVKEVMIRSIRILSQMFQDRKILFLRSLLSSNQLLVQLAQKKELEFYEGLKMRLLAMDDEEFKEFNLFSQDQWFSIIHTAISKSFSIIRSQLKNPNYTKKKLVPFAGQNEESITLNNLSETMDLLYKKSLRTKKLPLQIFISKDLTQAFYTFNFGSGAQAMQKLLKLYPFAFTFESRLQKFKQLVKEDKLKHDRTLFLQQEVDDDLIIHVRRGKEFLDAYHSLINKDLRKKYKLVFFNQQGLQQQGIDGGGLIKQFINRVLKSAFSQVYGLFYQNSLHQLLPNPDSPSLQEYEFIGKIIGKAVYESITIEQKFVEPFLNLVIGRKNSFQDIQYIDPTIYKSLIEIKKLKNEDLQDLQQTFVILDQLPNGQQRYVNLLCPSRPVKGLESQQVLVTRQNKLQFIMAYSDFKCNKQLQEKTRSFRKGFLKVLKPQWLTLFNNQELNQIISGGEPNFDVRQLKQNCVYVDYHEKSLTVVYFWEVLNQFTAEQKSHFLLYVTSCSRPPTLGFGSMKPKMCISRDENVSHLPTANTCMNVLRLPDYKDKEVLKKKLLYAIYSKAGFEFA